MKVVWVSDVPTLNTGFGVATRTFLKYFKMKGIDVACYSLSTTFDFENDGYPVRALLGRESELNTFDAAVFFFNPIYSNNIALYYATLFKNLKTRRIGYFVHEARYIPRDVGEIFYTYQGEYDLVFTTPAQDLWGYSRKYPERVHFIPHGYFPRSHKSLERRWVTSVMTNIVRKKWNYIFWALPKIKWHEFRFVTDLQGFYAFEQMLDAIKDQLNANVIIGREDNLNDLYDSTKLLLQISAGEGFSLPVLEALEAGADVVATDLPELRELYGDQIYYVSSRLMLSNDGQVQLDPIFSDMVQKINYALSHPKPNKDVSRYEISRVGEKFIDLLLKA